MATRNLWSREELILAFNFYLKLPFGKMTSTNKEVIQFANLIGRTPSSIAIRLTNYAACDPYHKARGVKGMIGGIKQCQPIWDEFFENKETLIFESERILAEKENLTIESKFDAVLDDIRDLKGEVKLREVKTRVNQNFFRQLVLANYKSKCAVTGIDIPELLFASHIIPWSKNEQERLNPENGICLSALYDKAFDKGLIGINESHIIIISNDLKRNENKEYYKMHFTPIENTKIQSPERFLPNKTFLEYHMDEVFALRNS
jgi:putative restriction endonuclease